MVSSVSGQGEPNPALIGYPSVQDGAISPTWDGALCLERENNFLVFFIPCDKSFIDQPCSVKMAGHWFYV